MRSSDSTTRATKKISFLPRFGFRTICRRAIVAVMVALAFTLGVYREPIQQAAIGLTTTKAVDADAAYAAYMGKNYATALRLARPLAAEGDARAQSVLGNLYYRGRGVPQDHNEALKWFRRAADQDDVAAQFYVGLMFHEGQGVPQDHAEAANWFRRAADLGDAHAQYNLGVSYASGMAGKPDNVSAHMWFSLAAAHFPTGADQRAAVNSRDLLAKKMTGEQIAEAEKGASEWKK
jgi:TPR repeat protein